MPSRLSPSPPALPASSSPEAMSVTETRQQNEPGYNTYRPGYNHVLHPSYYNGQGSATSSSRTSPQSHQSPSFSLANSAPSEHDADFGDEKHLETNTSPLGPIIKRDDSEEVSNFSKILNSLQSPSAKYISTAAPVSEDPKKASQRASHGTTPRRDISKRMGISSLINSDDSSSAPTYEIVIRQQPIAARACGFGDRDRRVIDPPAILQMLVRDPKATSAELDSKMRHPFSVIHCELWNAELDQEETAMPEVGERPQQRRLMGTLVASPFVGRDEFGEEGCFFPFPDLSCRASGKYRLKFVLLVLNPERMKMGDKLPFKATALSNVFEVFPAKTFPGMIPSTALTKRLKEQGCLISVKKGHQKVSTATEERPSTMADDDDDDPDDDNANDDHMEGREKRRKTSP